MDIRSISGLALATLVCACQAQSSPSAHDNKAEHASTAAAGDPIASAESAAPATIAKAATIMTVGADGAMAEVRKGSNGWTCMPDSPATPGPDPMCMDGNGLAWVQSWVAHKPPPANAVGLIYMLEGGTDGSNTDPYATQPGGADWIKTGAHLMVIGAPSLNAKYPSGEKPDTSAPYVMWAGTPYAHLMVPTQ